MAIQQRRKITPFLWFDGNAEEAMRFYVSVFENSRVLGTTPGPDGKLMGCSFELDGVPFMALNGGPMFKFTEAISMFVSCETQAEVDHYWDRLLSGGGSPSQCGWLKDRFGLSWQIIPTALMELMADRDSARAGRAVQATLQMSKIDIAKLRAAADAA